MKGTPLTITGAIEQLESIKARHGGEVSVYFDCPHCGRSTAPDKIVVVVTKTTAVLGASDE